MITSDVEESLDIPICLQFCVQFKDIIICPKEQNIQKTHFVTH